MLDNNSKSNIENSTFTPPHQLETAVLFLVFNRLDTTKQVFQAIREAKPPRLYIAADGARESKEGEAEKVKAVRDYILQNIDWDCEVKTLFREKNLSCVPSVNGAISWFFEHEEMGIILEDDTKPNISFFYYCEELLEMYKNDKRVGMISGNNHTSLIPLDSSYVFSKFFWTWGWATWRRCWKDMDFNLDWERTEYSKSIVNNMGYTKKSVIYWEHNIEAIHNKKVNAWDYQWFLSLSSQNQLCIFPAFNLVSNVGFGEDATHTFGEAPEKYTNQKELIFPLRHPKYVLPLVDFENIYEKENVKVQAGWKKLVPFSFKRIIKKIIKYK